MNKRNIGIFILIFVLIGLMISIFVLTKKEIINETTININGYKEIVLKENKDLGQVKIYDAYYDIYLCNVDATVKINGKTYTLEEALKQELIDPDDIVFYTSIYWNNSGKNIDDGGPEIYTRNKYVVTKYHKMLPNKNPARSAVDYYDDLFISTNTCKIETKY